MTAELKTAMDGYRARLAAMTDAELAVETARIEALDGPTAHHLVDAECEYRQAREHAAEVAQHAALLALMAPPTLWTVTG